MLESYRVSGDEMVVDEWYWSQAHGAIKVVTLTNGSTVEVRSASGLKIFAVPINIYTLPLSTLNFHIRQLERCGLSVPESLLELRAAKLAEAGSFS